MLSRERRKRDKEKRSKDLLKLAVEQESHLIKEALMTSEITREKISLTHQGLQ